MRHSVIAITCVGCCHDNLLKCIGFYWENLPQCAILLLFQRQEDVMSYATRIITLILAGILTLSLVGCNTISGLGQDVSAGGKALTKSADKTHEDMSTSSHP
ncbi:MAG: hypothetical protein CL816_05810 [Coxiellaceae bacterium]|nr:hypothetical protein [Coxiellaceae bacterium]